MKISSAEILCCPECKSSLCILQPRNGGASAGKVLACSCCQRAFPSENDVINFLLPEDEMHFSKRFEVVRAAYNAFYTPLTNLMFLPCGGAAQARHEVLDNIEIFPGARVLETGIGTGDNLPMLNGALSGCTYYGIDIQPKMLRMCNRNLNRWSLDATLYIANAERLPFRDGAFDVVFHLGAINLFNDKERAIREMIRVAQPGTRIVIADENQRAVKYFSIFVGNQPEVVPPVDLIPPSMEDIRLETIWNGFGYLISFRVPA